jgi:hypothetical protein
MLDRDLTGDCPLILPVESGLRSVFGLFLGSEPPLAVTGCHFIDVRLDFGVGLIERAGRPTARPLA